VDGMAAATTAAISNDRRTVTSSVPA
jgi:hypothetical protein